MPVAWTSFFFFFFFFTKAINQSINQSNQSFKQTGASSGIGAAVAKLFAKEGASVAATGRNEAALAALVEDIASAGGSAKFFAADVTDDAAVAGEK